MTVGTNVGRPAPDKLVRIAMMASRFGFLIAAILGVARMTGTVSGTLEIHMGAGILTSAGIWLSVLRLASLKRSRLAPAWIGGLLALVGPAMAMGMIPAVPGLDRGTQHLLAMLLAFSMTEMGVGRANKAA